MGGVRDEDGRRGIGAGAVSDPGARWRGDRHQVGAGIGVGTAGADVHVAVRTRPKTRSLISADGPICSR